MPGFSSTPASSHSRSLKASVVMAGSRARAPATVCSPMLRLLRPRSVEHMRLVNASCRLNAEARFYEGDLAVGPGCSNR